MNARSEDFEKKTPVAPKEARQPPAPGDGTVTPVEVPSAKRGGRRRALMLSVPLLIAVAAGGFWLFGGRFESTDNAYVTAEMAQVTPYISGTAVKVHVKDTQAVKAGTVLVERRAAQVQVEGVDRGAVHEARHPGPAGGGARIARALDVDLPDLAGGVADDRDHRGEVKHDVGAVERVGERRRVEDVRLDVLDVEIVERVGATNVGGTHLDALVEQRPDEVGPNKSVRSGDGGAGHVILRRRPGDGSPGCVWFTILSQGFRAGVTSGNPFTAGGALPRYPVGARRASCAVNPVAAGNPHSRRQSRTRA